MVRMNPIMQMIKIYSSIINMHHIQGLSAYSVFELLVTFYILKQNIQLLTCH